MFNLYAYDMNFTIIADVWYDGDRAIITFAGISDFSGYTIEDGDWSDPEPTSEEQLRADVDYIMAMEGIQ